MAWSKGEMAEKLNRVRHVMAADGLRYLLVTTQVNFFWLTGGRPYVNLSAEKACGDLLITQDKVVLIASNIEAGRLMNEELSGLEIETSEYSWWETAGQQNRLQEITGDGHTVTDTELGLKFGRLRWDLTPQEQERYTDTGRCVARILEEAAFAVTPGMTELAMAGIIKQKALALGVEPWVTLVAADERIYQYRHPLPTANKLKNYVMLVLTGQKHGLYAAATRLVHFGAVPAAVRKLHEAVTKVDACFIGHTQAGAKVQDIFAAGKRAYADVGFAGQWQYHHQGGMAGYNAREFRGTDDCDVIVKTHQAYAWNPSIAGSKSEDTYLLQEHGLKLLTASPEFPFIEAEYDGLAIKRPAILVR